MLSDLRSIKDFMIGVLSKASLLLKLAASLDWDIALNMLGNSAVAERFSYSVVIAGSKETIIEVCVHRYNGTTSLHCPAQ